MALFLRRARHVFVKTADPSDISLTRVACVPPFCQAGASDAATVMYDAPG